MRRREFITLLGGAAAWPTAAHAQQPGRLPIIGYVAGAAAAAWAPWTSIFVQRLRELGWIEGRTIAIEYRSADGRTERFDEIAAEFVRLKVDVILTAAAGAFAAKQATSVIPIVFVLAGDPVGTGLIASLARPGGNITGLSVQNSDLAGKRVELLREVLPSMRRLGILGNVVNFNAVLEEIDNVEAAARTLRVETTTLEVRKAEDIAPAFEAVKGSVDAIYVVGDALTTTSRGRINTLAAAARLPTISNQREFVEAGAFMSYGPNFQSIFRRAAEFVDKILHGAKPADIPVEQPTKFDLVVNLTTAKAIGLTVPESFLLRADKVIE